MCNKSPNNYDLGLKTSAIIKRERKHVLNENLKWFCYRWFLLVEANYRIIMTNETFPYSFMFLDVLK